MIDIGTGWPCAAQGCRDCPLPRRLDVVERTNGSSGCIDQDLSDSVARQPPDDLFCFVERRANVGDHARKCGGVQMKTIKNKISG